METADTRTTGYRETGQAGHPHLHSQQADASG